MNTSEPAEQIVRVTIDEMVVFLKVAGELSKNAIAMLSTICKERGQTMGKTTLKNMLKTGTGLKLYSIDAKDLKTFSKEAKNYGILYCALTSRKEDKIDGTIDLMIREEDSARVNRIAKRFNFVTVDITAIEHDLEREKEAREKGLYADENSRKTPVEVMVDDLLGTEEKEQDAPINEEELEQELIKQIQNPSNTQELSTENESQSEHLSNTKKKGEKAEEIKRVDNVKKSVREELNSIVAEQEEKKQKEKQQEQMVNELVSRERQQANNWHKAQHRQKRKQKGKRYKEPKHLLEK